MKQCKNIFLTAFEVTHRAWISAFVKNDLSSSTNNEFLETECTQQLPVMTLFACTNFRKIV